MSPQGRKLKLANHWATMPTLQLALERTFISDREPFASPLNCSMSAVFPTALHSQKMRSSVQQPTHSATVGLALA